MKYTKKILSSALLATALPALAQEVPAVTAEPVPYTFMEAIKAGTPMTSFRLRYEDVDQDPSSTFPHDAHALTMRSLIGWQTASYNNFSVGVQIINVSKLDDDFNDKSSGVNQAGRSTYPVVADPDFTNINQLYLDWTGIRDTKVRLGRQSVKLDNVRFIGNVEFRQVMQVFDGLSVENKSIPNVDLYGAFFTRNRNINTDLKPDNTGILHAAYHLSPTETLTGYSYFYNQQDVVAASSLSNKIFGARLDGAHKLDDHWKLLYTAEYAKQDALGDTDGRTVAQGQIDAYYYKLGGGAGYDNFSLRADQELLSSNGGKYAFQTPLGTNHLFQGWVDKFLVTPNQGLQDTFITAGYKYGDLALYSEYHWFKADQNFAEVGGGTGDDFGQELDFSVAYTFNKNILAKLEYGKYSEGDQRAVASTGGAVSATANRIRDTDKVWLTAMYTF
ncbi:MAG TPA: alginate export family protein [Methylophilaceae bacterium]